MLEAVYAPPSVSSSSEGKCRAILANVDVEGWACGRSKVMLRFDHSTVLDAQCSFVYIKVVTIQRCKLLERGERGREGERDYFGE